MNSSKSKILPPSIRARHLWNLIRREKNLTAFKNDLLEQGMSHLNPGDVEKFILEHRKLEQFELIELWNQIGAQMSPTQIWRDWAEKQDRVDFWKFGEKLGQLPKLEKTSISTWSRWAKDGKVNLIQERVKHGFTESEFNLLFRVMAFGFSQDLRLKDSNQNFKLIETIYELMPKNLWKRNCNQLIYTLIENNQFKVAQEVVEKLTQGITLDLNGFAYELIEDCYQEPFFSSTQSLLNLFFEKGLLFCGMKKQSLADSLVEHYTKTTKRWSSTGPNHEKEKYALDALQWFIDKAPDGQSAFSPFSLTMEIMVQSNWVEGLALALQHEHKENIDWHAKHYHLLNCAITEGNGDIFSTLIDCENIFLTNTPTENKALLERFFVKGNAVVLSKAWACLPATLEALQQESNTDTHNAFYDRLQPFYDSLQGGEQKIIHQEWAVVSIWLFRNHLNRNVGPVSLEPGTFVPKLRL